MRITLFVSILMTLSLSACASLQYHDDYLNGDYRPSKKELEIFKKLSSEYNNIIDFSTKNDHWIINYPGEIREGTFFYTKRDFREYNSFKVIIPFNIDKVAVMVKVYNLDGSLGIFGGARDGIEITVRSSGYHKYRFNPNSWTLIEFIKTDTGTNILINRKIRYKTYFYFRDLEFLNFGQMSAYIDFVLYNTIGS